MEVIGSLIKTKVGPLKSPPVLVVQLDSPTTVFELKLWVYRIFTEVDYWTRMAVSVLQALPSATTKDRVMTARVRSLRSTRWRLVCVCTYMRVRNCVFVMLEKQWRGGTIMTKAASGARKHPTQEYRSETGREREKYTWMVLYTPNFTFKGLFVCLFFLINFLAFFPQNTINMTDFYPVWK